MMADARKSLGNQGEAYASDYLRNKGFQIIGSQELTPFGEIDLVCLDGDEVVFVEVKTRRSRTYGYPEDSVTKEKLRHVVGSADYLLKQRNWTERPWRIDVVALEYHSGDPEVLHFEGIDIPDDFC